MAITAKSNPVAPIRHTWTGDLYDFILKFDTVTGTADPDGVNPDLSTDDEVVVAHQGTNAGEYTITFAEHVKPYEMLWGDASILGDQAQLDAKVVSYTQSTGVLLVKVYDEDDTSGISAAANSNDVTVQVRCVFTRSGGGTV